MKKRLIYSMLISGLAIAVGCSPKTAQEGTADTTQVVAEPAAPAANTLTEEEKAAGWQLLFDGQSTAGWHSYLKSSAEGWHAMNGELMTHGGTGGDLVTDAEFENFELSFEWKVAPKGNSGVFYFVVEDPKYSTTYVTGPEYQLIDDENYPAELQEAQHSGANYDINPPTQRAAKPAGEYNHGRILVNGNQVEHWLNGVLVAAYELDSEDWKQRVAASKFGKMEGYAKARKGHIALQDHGDMASFRNVKIRPL